MSSKLIPSLVMILASLQEPTPAKKPEMNYKPINERMLVNLLANFDVYQAPTFPLEIPAVGLQYCQFGVTDMNERKMVVNNLLATEYRQLVVLHEMQHVRLFHEGVKLPHPEDKINDYACKDYKRIFETKDCPDKDDFNKAFGK